MVTQIIAQNPNRAWFLLLWTSAVAYVTAYQVNVGTVPVRIVPFFTAFLGFSPRQTKRRRHRDCTVTRTSGYGEGFKREAVRPTARPP